MHYKYANIPIQLRASGTTQSSIKPDTVSHGNQSQPPKSQLSDSLQHLDFSFPLHHRPKTTRSPPTPWGRTYLITWHGRLE